MEQDSPRELAFYYPNPMWRSGEWVKNLILFFDGIALLVPTYMKNQPQQIDPSTVTALETEGLLEIIEPEHAVGQEETRQLANAMRGILDSGVLDDLKTEGTALHTISMSRLGYYGDENVYKTLLKELKDRKLAKDSEDGVSIPMQPVVRSAILVLLSQILRPYGNNIRANLNPATDSLVLVNALTEFLSLKKAPSSAHVVQFDLNTVSVDLSAIPYDEVLDFRKQNLQMHRRYMLAVRKFAMELSSMTEEQQNNAFEIRQRELDDLASDLKNCARKAWKRRASFALTYSGSALSVLNPVIGAAFSFLGNVLRHLEPKQTDPGVYSYLFRSQARWSYR